MLAQKWFLASYKRGNINVANTESKLHEVDPIYFEDDLKKAYSKYSFNYTINGTACRTWYDSDEEVAHFDGGNAGEFLFQLTMEIERSIEECGAKSGIDIHDLRKFALKHVQAVIRVDNGLRRAPAFITTEMTEAEMPDKTQHRK
jgi:hypothetical protein